MVSYFNLETSIEATIGVTADTGTGNGLISAGVKFYNGLNTTALAGSGAHTITSNSADNSIVGGTGTLKIEASQDAEDTLIFAGLTDKLFILGTSPGVINVELNGTDNLVLTGFERLQDAATNDIYDMVNLTNVVGQLTFLDSAEDHDMLVLRGTNGVNFNGSGALIIDLDNLSATVGGLNMDFDVLDIRNVTTTGITVNGGTNVAPVEADAKEVADDTDELVLGALAPVTTVNDFESIVLTAGSVVAGNTFTFTTGVSLVQGGTTVALDADATALSFGGLALEGSYGDGRVAAVTTGVNVTVVGAAANVIGGSGADTITGGAGADFITGGAGADVLDGGIVPEVQEVQTVVITGAFGVDGSNDGAITIGGITLTEAAAAVAGISVLDGSDADTIGAAFAAIDTATWETALTLGAGDLNSVSYDALNNVLSFTFATGVDAVDASVLAASAGYVAGTDTGAINVGAGTDVAYAAQGEAADTFAYVEGDSTEAAMDEIHNFSVGAVDDKIDFTGIAVLSGHTYPEFFNGGSAFADYAAVKAAAVASIASDDFPYIGSDGTDTWIFIDNDHDSNFEATDTVIKLVGIDATGIDIDNFVAW